jgi:hypothetical protein
MLTSVNQSSGIDFYTRCTYNIPQAEVAQMVEQRTENPRVPSSILGLGTSNYYRQPVAEQTCITPAEVAEW